MSIFHGFVEFIQRVYAHGEVWMHPIAATGVIGMGLVLYRLFFLIFVYNIGGKGFTDQVIKLVISGQFDRAIKFCNSKALAILPKVMRAGLTRNGGEPEVIETAMEEVAILYLPKASKYIDLVGTLANMATLFGLLATIAGMISAFEVVANAPPEKRGEMLTASIAIALNGTMFGLVVALPLFFCHGLMVTLSDKIQADVEYGAKTLLNTLTIGTSMPMNQSGQTGKSYSYFDSNRHARAPAFGGGTGESTHGGTAPGVPSRFRKTG